MNSLTLTIIFSIISITYSQCESGQLYYNGFYVPYDNIEEGSSYTYTCTSSGSVIITCESGVATPSGSGCGGANCSAGCIAAGSSDVCWTESIEDGETIKGTCSGSFVGDVDVLCSNSVVSQQGECVTAYLVSGIFTPELEDVHSIRLLQLTVVEPDASKEINVACSYDETSVTCDPVAANSTWELFLISDGTILCQVDNSSGESLTADVNVEIVCNTEVTTTTHPESSSDADATMAIIACFVLMFITFGTCITTFWYFYTHKDLANAITRRRADKERENSKNSKGDQEMGDYEGCRDSDEGSNYDTPNEYRQTNEYREGYDNNETTGYDYGYNYGYNY